MENILKFSESLISSSEQCEAISLIAYIAGLSPEMSTTIDIDYASKIFYCAISNVSGHSVTKTVNAILYFLNENDKNSFIDIICENVETYKIFIHCKWFFQVVILLSVRNIKSFLAKNIENVTSLQEIILWILKYINISNPQTIHLLRVLEIILKRQPNIITYSLSEQLLQCTSKLYSSSITSFKSYSSSISKLTLKQISSSQTKYLCNLENLPIRGIDLPDVLKLIPKNVVFLNIEFVIQKILFLFANNIENREGGFIYESVIEKCAFEEWTLKVWPLFQGSMQEIEYEGEFSQSLLKFWIPITVRRFKSEFFRFIRNETLDYKLKADVLLETRKRGYYNREYFEQDSYNFFKNFNTRSLALRIISTYFKKSTNPNQKEIDMMKEFFLSYHKDVMEEDVQKSLKLFLSQIFLYSHATILRNSSSHEVSCDVYEDFIAFLYQECKKRFKTNSTEVGAQILKILWDVCTGNDQDLDLHYHVNKHDKYGTGENLFYSRLKQKKIWRFDDDEILEILKTSFLKNQGYCSHLGTVICERYSDKADIITFKEILDTIETLRLTKTLQSTEKVKNYCKVFVSCETSDTFKNECLYRIVELLTETNLKNAMAHYQNLFANVLYLEILIVFSERNLKHPDLNGIISSCLSVVEGILDNGYHLNLNSKDSKVLEAFINNAILVTMENKHIWDNLDKNLVLNQICKIIQKSNLKKPVSMSIELIKQFGSFLEETNAYKTIKIKFLDKILRSIQSAPEVVNLKIRRNPETRLVIHAICVSEKHPQKPYLSWSLNSLLDILSDSSSSDRSISSALHCIEVLISDNKLQNHTLPFINNITKYCVDLFKKPNWVVRNADLQLVKSLIERFLGVSIGIYNRPKTIQDFFLNFPELPGYFYKILAVDNLNDSSIIVFLFFLESQIRNDIFRVQETEGILSVFQELFVHIIKNYPGHYGRMSVRSYISLCEERKISEIFGNIVEYLTDNICKISNNILSNFIYLLEELYDKFRSSIFCISDAEKINSALKNLWITLRVTSKNNLLYNYLLIKVIPLDVVLQEFETYDSYTSIDFQKRIWMHNYIPFLIINIESKKISQVLKKVLDLPLLECMKVKALSILVERFSKNEFDDIILDEILDILFSKSLTVEDKNNYVFNCYFSVIVLFCEKLRFISLEKNLTLKGNFIKMKNFYRIMIYVIFLSSVKLKTLEDSMFLKYALEEYVKSLSVSEDDILYDISTTLKYLYKSVNIQDRCDVLKVAFYLLFQDISVIEICYFLASILQVPFSSVIKIVEEFLTYENLLKILGNNNSVNRILNDFYKYASQFPERFEESETFYSVQNDLSLSKEYVLCILENILEKL